MLGDLADMHGFPPMLIQVGENEILYDDAIRIRDAATTAGVDVAFERGGMESTSDRYLSLPGCPNPPPRSNAWQPS